MPIRPYVFSRKAGLDEVRYDTYHTTKVLLYVRTSREGSVVDL